MSPKPLKLPILIFFAVRDSYGRNSGFWPEEILTAKNIMFLPLPLNPSWTDLLYFNSSKFILKK